MTVATTTKTLTSAGSSISFTSLAGEPTSFAIISNSDLATGASPYKVATVVFDGTNVIGQQITNTNNAQASYDSTSFTKAYSSGTLTVSSSGPYFQAVTYSLIYTYGGATSNIGTANVQVGSGATSITFTGLSDEPDYFSCIFKSNFGTSSGYQRVIAVAYDGTSTYGLEMDSGAKYSSAHWSYTYNSGSLTISSSGTNAGGYFHQPGNYQLTYGFGAGGGGGGSVLVPKTITENGTYDPADDNADGYSEVTVTVPTGGTPRTSSDLQVSGATVTAPAGTYASDASASVASLTLPTSASSSATSGYASKATISRSTSDQYINIGTGYNSAGAYYKVNATPNGTVTAPASISGSSATVSTGTNTLTLTKTVSVTPSVSTAGYVSSGTAGNSSVSLTASVTTKAATTYHPSTSDQTISSGTYTTGTQTIKAVTLSNLTADNIKSGVIVKVGDSTDDDCVTSVTGIYTGGGGSLSVDTKTVTASQYPVSISFSSMKGEPKYFFLRSTSQISSSGSTTYYYIIDMRYDGGTNHYCNGNVFRIGSTRRVEVITTASSGGVVNGYTWSYSGTTLTITSSAASRSASPGSFNNTYELVYLY